MTHVDNDNNESNHKKTSGQRLSDESLSRVDLLEKNIILTQENEELSARYTALFRLNELSQDCDNLADFYPQVHRTIASLMTAKKFIYSVI